MRSVAVSRREFSDAMQFVGGCSLLGGIGAWIIATIWRLASGDEVDVERWFLNGGGMGGLGGFLFLLADSLL